MSPFAASPAQIAELVATYPLAWVVSGGGENFAATPLPLLGEPGPDGVLISLFGHFARSNPQVAMIERDPRATILFLGPNDYISPNLVSNPTWGATWNYAMARFDVDIRFVPEETGEAVYRLAALVEQGQPEPWTPDRMGPRYAELLPRIIAFRATVRGTNAKFKLGQDEQPGTFAEIVTGLGETDLARWMSKAAAEPTLKT